MTPNALAANAKQIVGDDFNRHVTVGVAVSATGQMVCPSFIMSGLEFSNSFLAGTSDGSVGGSNPKGDWLL